MKRTGIMYRDIADDIKRKIFDERYSVGSLIPTENELAKQYEVSKITIRNAVEILVGEGYLDKKSGKGTFVISNRPFNHLSQAASFSSILEEEGHRVTKRVLGIAVVSEKDKPRSFDNQTDEITKISRLYYLDEQPYIYTDHYVKAAFSRLATQDLERYSLYHVLQTVGVLIKRFEDTFSIGSVPQEVEDVLKVSSNKALYRVRCGYDSSSDQVEYSVSFYNTDVHPYQMQYEV